jgi:hypothetical protein
MRLGLSGQLVSRQVGALSIWWFFAMPLNVLSISRTSCGSSALMLRD